MEKVNFSTFLFTITNIKLVSANQRLTWMPKYKKFVPNYKYQKAAKELQEQFSLQIKDCPTFETNIKIEISIQTYKDIDNMAKPLIDALQEIGVIKNDREVLWLNMIKKKGKRGTPENICIKISGNYTEGA